MHNPTPPRRIALTHILWQIGAEAQRGFRPPARMPDQLEFIRPALIQAGHDPALVDQWENAPPAERCEVLLAFLMNTVDAACAALVAGSADPLRVAELAQQVLKATGELTPDFDLDANLQDKAYGQERLRMLYAAGIIDGALHSIESAENLGATDDGVSKPKRDHDARPVYLTSWQEILSALNLKADDKSAVRKLNKDYDGPILMPKKGGQPSVERHRLLEWHEGIERLWEEMKQRERDEKATKESSYAYGKEGTVLPNISGSVKKRRKDRKP